MISAPSQKGRAGERTRAEGTRVLASHAEPPEIEDIPPGQTAALKTAGPTDRHEDEDTQC